MRRNEELKHESQKYEKQPKHKRRDHEPEIKRAAGKTGAMVGEIIASSAGIRAADRPVDRRRDRDQADRDTTGARRDPGAVHSHTETA
jgi:hypothetical protein